MTKQKRQVYRRRVAFLFLISIVFQVIYPTAALALTTGPSQPEVQSFEPIEANNMVNMFSGDFTYNLPLLTVPGPSGGYPVNLSYHAGATMEEEASWVGLGWNINPGVINRNMRGVPDDFNGDNVTKEISQKVNRIFSLGGGFGTEVKGNPSGLGLGGILSFDNYKGLSLSANANFSGGFGKTGNFSIGANFDPESGIGINPSVGIGDKNEKFSGRLNASYNSRQGLMSVGLSMQYEVPGAPSGINSAGAGIKFGTASSVPHQNIKYSGLDLHFMAKIGNEIPLFRFPHGYGQIGYKEKRLQSSTISSPAYGYLNSENNNSDLGLYDFNKDNNGPISYDANALEMPVATYDIYQASGQGISGVFRAQRSDLGIYTDPSVSSNFDDVNIGGEFGATPNPLVYGIPDLHVGINAGFTYSQTYSGKWKDFDSELRNYLSFKSGLANYDASGNQISNSSRTSTYFKNASETVANNYIDNEINRIGGATPIAFDFNMAIGDLAAVEPKAKKARWGQTGNAFTYVDRKENDRRNTNFHYRLIDEINNDATAGLTNNLYNFNTFPGTSAGTSIYNSLPSGHKTHHIGEISIYKEDGMKYVYGLPVYNTAQNEVMFNVVNADNPVAPTTVTGYDKWANYSTGDDSPNNNKGADNFYSSNNLPAYAHSYMLTAIYSPDYVDLTGNGPSEDDFGYYVKFNYSKINNYKWRTPIAGANWDKGYYSNAGDDRGSYLYGEKEVCYLNSIETKSHIAEFILGSRKDSREAAAKTNVSTPFIDESNNGKLQKLEKIVLRSKNDLNNSIKTVHFNYDYSLCKNSANSKFGSLSQAPNYQESGKLTLKSVAFSFQENEKGLLTPYTFSYERAGYEGYDNPDYDPTKMDRWGNYKGYPESHYADKTKRENDPYVEQGLNAQEENDKYAGAWNLKQINMPSGASINVNYESDDYAYVQNKRAMQMFEIERTGGQTHQGNNEENLKTTTERFDKLYFNLNKPIPVGANVQSELNKYVEGVDNMFFKAFVTLKRLPVSTIEAEDYVEGYCKLIDEADKVGVDASCKPNGTDYTQAYIRVKFVKTSKTDDEEGKLHPFRKAAFEYMKLNRPDLFFPNNFTNQNSNIGIQFISSILNVFSSVEELFTGYYNACRINGYAGKLLLTKGNSKYRPSFIRLNNPEFRKDGGGHRVKSILINDNWNTMLSSQKSYQYGQEFHYVLQDGKSSGVAEYEPILGGEEIPLRQPSDKFAAERKIINRQKEFYSEEPYGEALFPSAGVGYSRVIVKNIDPPDPYGTNTADNSKSKNGIAVHEFYTAKDFPIKVTKTEAQKKKADFSIDIPFVGSKSSSTAGHTQGYTVELNDMHGKPKSDATYGYASFSDLIGTSTTPNLNPAYKTKTAYVYNTATVYNPNVSNAVKSLVPVIENNGAIVNKEMGVTYDFSTYMGENSNFSVYAGDDFNFDLNWTPFTFPPLIPFIVPIPLPVSIKNRVSLQLTEDQTRTITTTKTIVRNGILMETQQYLDGSRVVNKNLAFDGESGNPILTTSINEFDKPVYNYEYKAHWAYPEMKNNGTRYRNVISNLTLLAQGNSEFELSGTNVDFTKSFKEGDLLYLYKLNSNKFYGRITEILTTSVTVVAESTTTTLPTGTSNDWIVSISKPIESNQQSASNGFISSLSNPVTSKKAPFWNSINDYLSNNTLSSTTFSYMFYDSCNASFDGLIPSYSVSADMVSTNKIELVFTDPNSSVITVSIINSTLPFFNGTNYLINNYRFFFVDAHHVLIKNIITGASAVTLYEVKGRFDVTSCMDGVLRANATTFRNVFSYDYIDIGDPNSVLVNQLSGSVVSSISTNVSSNPYKFGKTGVWKMVDSYEYLASRNQSVPHSNIAKDGQVNEFNEFDWNNSGAYSKWNKSNSITLYSPYGFELENKDILNNFSSALYGYNNQLATSVAKNAGYYETAFDGFEDYGSSVAATKKSGHFKWSYSDNSSLALSNGNIGHTGVNSISIPSGKSLKTDFNFVTSVPGQSSNYGLRLAALSKYSFSCWVKETGAVGANYSINPSNIASFVTIPTGVTIQSATISNYQIEGWRRVEVVFFVNSTSGTGTIVLNPSVNVNVDDVRLQPFNSSQKTYVYDPNKLWLVAELDERNFATFYNYDEEGTLVQVKKETISGIVTLKTNRQNIKK
jgi:hypothetical protein